MHKIFFAIVGVYIACATLAATGLWFFVASLIDYYKG